MMIQKVIAYKRYNIVKQYWMRINGDPIVKFYDLTQDFMSNYTCMYDNINLNTFNQYTANTILSILFENGITWGRIIGAISLGLRHNNEWGMCVQNALDNIAGAWIKNNGGWDGALKFYGK